MIAAIADTHTALWYLLNNPRLSAPARTFIDNAAGAGYGIGLSPISLVEIIYLIEKTRLPESAYTDLTLALADSEYVIEETSLTGGIVEAMQQVPRNDVPDMPDRIVAATAVYYGVPVISRDGKIRASNVRTIW